MRMFQIIRAATLYTILAATARLGAQLYQFEGVITESNIPQVSPIDRSWAPGTRIVFTTQLFSPRLELSPDDSGDHAWATSYERLTVGDLTFSTSMPFNIKYQCNGFSGIHVGYFGFFIGNEYPVVNPVFKFGSAKNAVTTEEGLLSGMAVDCFEENSSRLYPYDETGPFSVFKITNYSIDGVYVNNATAVPEPATYMTVGTFTLLLVVAFLRRRLSKHAQ